jgi:hypothetical protein
MKITAVVSGDRDIIARLDRLPAAVQERLVSTITELTKRLYGAVHPPGHFSSYKQMSVDTYKTGVKGTVFFRGAGREAAAISALEYGAPGKRSGSRPPVTEHKRMQTHVWGRAISPMEVIVDKYVRHARLREMRFLRGPFAAIRDEAEQKMREAVEGAARETINA